MCRTAIFITATITIVCILFATAPAVAAGPASSTGKDSQSTQPAAGNLIEKLLARIKNPAGGPDYPAMQTVHLPGATNTDARIGLAVWMTAADMRLKQIVADIQGQRQESAAVDALLNLLKNEKPVGDLNRKALSFQACRALYLLGPTYPKAIRSLRDLQGDADPSISSSAKFMAALPAPEKADSPATAPAAAPLAATAKPVDSRSENQAGKKSTEPVKQPASRPAADDTGGFDKEGFDRAMKIVSDEATKHVLALGLRQTNLQAYMFLVGLAPRFIRDDTGRLNENADKAAFTSAVTSMTSDRVRRSRELTGEANDAAAFAALLIPTGAFLRTGGGFNASAFAAAFDNIDKEKNAKAANLLKTQKPGAIAMIHLLIASAACIDKSGKFDAALFNSRLAALKDDQFNGSEDERIATFRKLMGTEKPAAGDNGMKSPQPVKQPASKPAKK